MKLTGAITDGDGRLTPEFKEILRSDRLALLRFLSRLKRENWTLHDDDLSFVQLAEIRDDPNTETQP